MLGCSPSLRVGSSDLLLRSASLQLRQCLQRSKSQCCTCQSLSRSRYLALLHPIARCLPATFLFRILGGILAPDPAAANGLPNFCPTLTSRTCWPTPTTQLDRELVENAPTTQLDRSCRTFWFVQQHCRYEAERFPNSLFSDPVANQLRATGPSAPNCSGALLRGLLCCAFVRSCASLTSLARWRPCLNVNVTKADSTLP